jgi:tetratricopeptide (TPR) repeat protein
MIRALLLVGLGGVLAFGVVACTSGESGADREGVRLEVPEGRRSEALEEVALPELSRADPPVQAQIREAYSAIGSLRAGAKAPDADLAAAYGRYAMLLHAAEYHEAAAPAYRNAQALQPDDPRWPYHLAHVYRSEGHIAQSMNAFRRVLDLAPDDVATLVWLGRMHLDQGEPARAEPLFQKAQSVAPRAVAAHVGLGQSALAKKDFQRAVQSLEAALQIDPTAASVYSPLAMAYRGLGQTAKAESLAALWNNTEIPVPDPRRMELDMSLRSGLAYELRGVQALESGDYAAAAGLFRDGLQYAPGNTALSRSIRHKLGTALALSGDAAGAAREFEETVRLAPRGALDEPAAKASYSLGLMLASQGRIPQSVERLEAALRFKPNYLEARIALADVLRTSGRLEPAVAHYAEAVRLNPRATGARFGHALVLEGLGRFAEARRSLEESVAAQPDRPELSSALARVLAASPDPAVRDGTRAVNMARQLASSGTSDAAEALAMALAETGAFGEAVAVQRSAIDALRQAGLENEARRMEAALRQYETGRPARDPWPRDHPVHAATLQ